MRLRRRLIDPFERLLVRRFGVSLVSFWLTRQAAVPYVETIALETTGSRTGRRREVALFAFRDGGDLVVIASNGTSKTDPSWARNLAAANRARVRVRGRRRDVVAEFLTGDDRKRMWEEAVRRFPPYEAYAAGAAPREVPVICLRPAE